MTDDRIDYADPFNRLMIILQEFDLNARFIGLFGLGPVKLEIIDKTGQIIAEDTNADKNVLVTYASEWLLKVYSQRYVRSRKV